ncbi:MAG: DUF4336 domain-containing protein [Leptolyngbya sp. SIO4C1]|nr:DUF4336 domain-containing protein [Leptolyngbya sp. SIO4C1]
MQLQSVASDLWVAIQPLRFLGLEVGCRMTLVRLPSQGLVMISPIELQPADRSSIDRLGKVRHIVAPNLFHHLFVDSAQRLYPDAKLWGAADLAQKRPDLSLAAILDQPGSFESVLSHLPFRGFAALLPRGIKLVQETVFCHHPSRTLILTDTAFHFDQTSALSTRLAAKAIGSYNCLRPSRLEKWGTRDKARVEASVQQVLAWEFDRVIPAHGSIVDTDGKAQLQAGYEWFLNKSLA